MCTTIAIRGSVDKTEGDRNMACIDMPSPNIIQVSGYVINLYMLNLPTFDSLWLWLFDTTTPSLKPGFFLSLGPGQCTLIRHIIRFQWIVYFMVFYVFGQIFQSCSSHPGVLPPFARRIGGGWTRSTRRTRYTNLVHGCQQGFVWIYGYYGTVAHRNIIPFS